MAAIPRPDHPPLAGPDPTPNRKDTVTATSTAPKAPADPLDQLREARAQLDTARTERARLDERREAYAAQLREAQAEFDQLAANEPDQFDDHGLPVKNSRAWKLRAQLDQAQKSKWPDLIAGSDERGRQAEDRLRRLTGKHGVALARQAHDAGVAAIQDVRSRAAELRAALAAVRAPEPDLLWIATAAAGAIDGRSVWTDVRVGELEQALDAAEHMLPARLVPMTPYVGEEPSVFLAGGGGWIPARSAGNAELAEQPTPIEPPA